MYVAECHSGVLSCLVGMRGRTGAQMTWQVRKALECLFGHISCRLAIYDANDGGEESTGRGSNNHDTIHSASHVLGSTRVTSLEFVWGCVCVVRRSCISCGHQAGTWNSAAGGPRPSKVRSPWPSPLRHDPVRLEEGKQDPFVPLTRCTFPHPLPRAEDLTVMGSRRRWHLDVSRLTRVQYQLTPWNSRIDAKR